jgi:hypothetical protein
VADCTKGKANVNVGLVNTLYQVNAQAAIISVINTYGVVIPVPVNRKEDLPNFLKLMNPAQEWFTNSVCHVEGKKVYSNVPKFLQIVVWTCMHPSNQQSGDPLEESQLPFRFYGNDDELKNFFMAEREGSQKKGRYWNEINEVKEAEAALRPQFEVIGEKDPYSLYALLDAILLRVSSATFDEVWTAWDTSLSRFPKNGLRAIWADSKLWAGLMTKKEGPKYDKAVLDAGYTSCGDNVHAIQPPENSKKTKRPRKKESAKEPNSKRIKHGEASEDQDRSKKSQQSADDAGLVCADAANASGDETTEDAHDSGGATTEQFPFNSFVASEQSADDAGLVCADAANASGDETTEDAHDSGGATTEQFPFNSFVASVPDYVWSTQDDMLATNKALIESAVDSIRKAVFACALVHAAEASSSALTKQDLLENFPEPVSDEMVAALHEMGGPVYRNMMGICAPAFLQASKWGKEDGSERSCGTNLANLSKGLKIAWNNNVDHDQPAAASTPDHAAKRLVLAEEEAFSTDHDNTAAATTPTHRATASTLDDTAKTTDSAEEEACPSADETCPTDNDTTAAPTPPTHRKPSKARRKSLDIIAVGLETKRDQ